MRLPLRLNHKLSWLPVLSGTVTVLVCDRGRQAIHAFGPATLPSCRYREESTHAEPAFASYPMSPSEPTILTRLTMVRTVSCETCKSRATVRSPSHLNGAVELDTRTE